MQNHDELTYELLHWSHGHRDDLFPYHGGELTGGELGDTVRRDMCRHLTGDAAPYNLVFTTNGIACTTATVIAASLGITDLDTIDEADTARIRAAHLLLAMYNALQPGVFALSGWDLCGMLTLPPDEVSDLLVERRHPLDQPARARPDGRQPARDAVGGRDAARHQPLRVAARAARRRHELRPPAAGDPRRPRALRRGDRAARSTSRTCRTRACS